MVFLTVVLGIGAFVLFISAFGYWSWHAVIEGNLTRGVNAVTILMLLAAILATGGAAQISTINTEQNQNQNQEF